MLMEKIIEDYENKVDGIYLFANDSVVDFYPKFGFRKSREYQFSKAVKIDTERTAQLVPMAEKSDWDNMVQILNKTEQNAKVYMVSNSGLYMFYLSQFMQENTFYIADCDSYAIAEIESDTLILHAVIGSGELDRVIAAFGKEIKKVILAFTPKDSTGYDKSVVVEEDTHLFVRGKFFDETGEDEKGYEHHNPDFPVVRIGIDLCDGRENLLVPRGVAVLQHRREERQCEESSSYEPESGIETEIAQ